MDNIGVLDANTKSVLLCLNNKRTVIGANSLVVLSKKVTVAIISIYLYGKCTAKSKLQQINAIRNNTIECL